MNKVILTTIIIALFFIGFIIGYSINNKDSEISSLESQLENNKNTITTLESQILPEKEKDINGCIKVLKPLYENNQAIINYTLGEIFVIFYEKKSEEECKNILSKYSLNVEKCLDSEGSSFTKPIIVPIGSELDWVCKLKNDPEIKEIEPDVMFTGTGHAL